MSTKLRTYIYQSSLAQFMDDLISEKRSLGYIYNTEATILKQFDSYWISHGNKSPGINREDLEEWLAKRDNEGASSFNRRIGIVGALSTHLNLCGFASYVPKDYAPLSHPVVHILSSDELRELFLQIDSYKPGSTSPITKRLASEYPILFRFLYCNGLRIGEAANLRREDVDLINGAITIYDGKGHKDRVVFMADDLKAYACAYQAYMDRLIGETPWFFPGRDKAAHISVGGAEGRFNAFWYATEASKLCDRKPTPHCLRHTHVVDRINSWMAENSQKQEIEVLMQYLRKSLGHMTSEETFYYYHLVDEAFKTVREKDTIGGRVIPEARRR